MNHPMKIIILLMLLLLSSPKLIVSLLPVNTSRPSSSSPEGEFRPMIDETTEYGWLKVDDDKDDFGRRRRRLAPFQLCLLCKCCAGTAPPNCATMPCCFGIDCHLPNKPYGVCAFVPKTCNCTSCAV